MTQPKETAARKQLIAQYNVSRETLARLDLYQSLLLRWSQHINLVASADKKLLWSRHFADCAQLLPFIDPASKHMVDIGSGAGLPGIVLALMLSSKSPHMRFTLIESNLRKAEFLRHIVRETGLQTEILDIRAEDYTGTSPSVIVSRAVAPLPKLLEMVAPMIGRHTEMIMLKGSECLQEIEEAKAKWRFTHRLYPSQTDSNGRIILLSSLEQITHTI